MNARDKCVDGSERAFDLNEDAVGVISDEAGEVPLLRETVDEGPKADALHYSADANASPYSFLMIGLSQPFTPHRNSAYRRQPQWVQAFIAVQGGATNWCIYYSKPMRTICSQGVSTALRVLMGISQPFGSKRRQQLDLQTQNGRLT